MRHVRRQHTPLEHPYTDPLRPPAVMAARDAHTTEVRRHIAHRTTATKLPARRRQ